MMLCHGYCDKYDACDEYYDIYDACDEYYEMHIMPVIFLVFLNVKKNCNGHFAVRFPEDARQSDQNQQQKQYLCRAFVALAHGKEPSLPCVFGLGARQRAFFAVRFFPMHGKGRHTPSNPGAVSCFFLPCAVEKRTAKIICRALSDAAHGKAAVSRSE
jgi:hypothetical protein